MSLLEDHELNDEQRVAITTAGDVLVVACPGSGKTRTLTFKIAYQLTQLQSEKQFIVAITYTHRAADQIHERIERLGIDTSQLWIGTIHSFCLEWILKPYFLYHPNLRYGFRVIDSHDKEALLTQLCESYAGITYWDCEFYFTPKGRILGCSDERKHEALHEIVGKYLDELVRRRQIDFELVLLYAYQLLSANPPIGIMLSNLFSHVLIDEYQDTKEIQYAIVAAILKAGAGKTAFFMVGDPNQAIFESLGGYAIEPEIFERMANVKLQQLPLSLNYRSSQKIVDYFRYFQISPGDIHAESKERTYPSLITYDTSTAKDSIEDELVRLIRYNIETLGISPKEVCVIAPWWMHLASVTRKLAARMPQYNFDGPGTVPFARDIDNFWYKLSKIVLTEPSPSLYTSRLRWAKEVLRELGVAGIDVSEITPKLFLRNCNAIQIAESDGLAYLHAFFTKLCAWLGVDLSATPHLQEHHDAFFQSSQARIQRLLNEGSQGIDNIASFRRVFASKSGITVSTAHGVKGAEYDTVIAYAVLEGMIPHFTDSNGSESARKLLYVICSRARKSLHLISETGRARGRRGTYTPTQELLGYAYRYDTVP